MLNRITIMIDDNLQQRLRKKQAEEIKKTAKGCSFSKILNLELSKSLGVKI